MKVAVVGSRGLTVSDLEKYLPDGVTEIVSGGAKGIDACAKQYAISSGIKLTEYLPKYEKYGRTAPLKRNIQIIDYADLVVAFWDGASHGTKFVIDNCKRRGIPVKVCPYLSGLSQQDRQGREKASLIYHDRRM